MRKFKKDEFRKRNGLIALKRSPEFDLFDGAFHDACIGGKRELERFKEVLEQAKNSDKLQDILERTDMNGNTYMHFAALSVSENAGEVIKLLHENMFNMYRRNNRGHTPTYLAIKFNSNNVGAAALECCPDIIDMETADAVTEIISLSNGITARDLVLTPDITAERDQARKHYTKSVIKQLRR